MKYEESYAQFEAGLLDLVLRAIPSSFTSSLKESGVECMLPLDRELELKIKYDVSEEGGALSLKFSWDNELGEEEDDDDEEEEETDDEED